MVPWLYIFIFQCSIYQNISLHFSLQAMHIPTQSAVQISLVMSMKIFENLYYCCWIKQRLHAKFGFHLFVTMYPNPMYHVCDLESGYYKPGFPSTRLGKLVLVLFTILLLCIFFFTKPKQAFLTFCLNTNLQHVTKKFVAFYLSNRFPFLTTIDTLSLIHI